MLTTFNEVDMKPLMDLRSRYKKDQFKEKHGVDLDSCPSSQKPFVLPQKIFRPNASIDKDEIIYPTIAIFPLPCLHRGLVVPVIRNAESLTFAQIEGRSRSPAGRGCDGKLSIEEMTGSTFSITNGGVLVRCYQHR